MNRARQLPKLVLLIEERRPGGKLPNSRNRKTRTSRERRRQSRSTLTESGCSKNRRKTSR